MRHKLTVENRIIRFIGFDLLLGFQLAELGWSDALYAFTGGAAIYLLATAAIGYCAAHSGFVLLQSQGKEATTT